MDSFHRIVDKMTPRTLVRKVIDTAPPQDTPSHTGSHHASEGKTKTKRKRKGDGDELRTKVLLQQQQSVNTSEVRSTDQTYANIANLTALASDDDSINESINLDAAAKFHRKKPQKPVELSNELDDMATKVTAKPPVPSPTRKRKPSDDAVPEDKTREKRSRISQTGAAEKTLEGDKTYADLSTSTLDSSLENISYDMPKRQQGSHKRLLVKLERLDIVKSQDITQISLNITEGNESLETVQTETRQKFARVAPTKRMELKVSGILNNLKTVPTEEAKGIAPDTALDTSRTVSVTDEVLEEELPVRDHASVSHQSILSSPGSEALSSSKRTTPQPRELLHLEVASPRKEKRLTSPRLNTSLSKPQTPQNPVSGRRTTKTATPKSRTPTLRPRTATPGSRTPTYRYTVASPGSRTPTSELRTTRARSRTPVSGLQTRAGSRIPTQRHTASSPESTTSSSRSKTATPSPSRSPTLRLKIEASPGAMSPSLKSPLKVSSLTHSPQPQSSAEKSKGEETAEAPTIPPPPSFQDAGEADEVVRSSFSSNESDELQVDITPALLLLESEGEEGKVSERVTQSYSSQSSARKNDDVFASPPISKSPKKSVIRELFGTSTLSLQKTEAKEDSPYFHVDIGSLRSASFRTSPAASTSPSRKTASPVIASASPSISQTSTSPSAQADPWSSESGSESGGQFKSTKHQVVTVATVHRVSEQDEQELVTPESDNEKDMLIDVGSEDYNVMERRDEVEKVDEKEEMEAEEEEVEVGENEAAEEAVDVEVMASQATDDVDVEQIAEKPREDEGERRMTDLTFVEEDAEERLLIEKESAEGRPVDDDDDEQINFLPIVKRPTQRSMMQTQAAQEQQQQTSSMMNVSVAMSSISTDEGTPAAVTAASNSRITAQQPRQLTMKEFIQTLATKPVMPLSVVSANTRLADMVKKLQESCAGQTRTKKPGRSRSTATQKKSKERELPAALSKNQTMEPFIHFSRCKVAAGSVGRIVEVCEEWWSNVLRDLEFLKQTRSTQSSEEITAEDVARLMKRQGLTNNQTELIALVEEYLPAEEWKHFKSTAYAHGKIFPNHVQTLLPD